MSIQSIISTAQGLRELKARGVIHELWIDAGQIRVSYADAPDARHRLTWNMAERMIKQHRQRKPQGVAMAMRKQDVA
jgi:YD repeat-containing protein